VYEEQSEVQCLPDNWEALQIFAALSTQWNVGMNGVVGMRYESFPVIFDAFGIKRQARSELMYLLSIMENEALRVFKDNG